MPFPRRAVSRRLAGVVCALAVSALSGCGIAHQKLSGQAIAAVPTPRTSASTTPPSTTSRPTPRVRHTPRPTATTRAPRTTTPPPKPTTKPSPTPRPTHAAPPPAPTLLPDRMADTRGSGQIVAVTNAGSGTDATLRAYQRSGGHWTQVFGPFSVKIGAGGFAGTVSEQTVASPIGLFTLTQAFGNDPDPGTRLPYHHVAYGDVWVDQSSSPHYNTLQTGDADGSKGTGEKLWTVIPEYDYGVVIDYNRAPIRPGAGSAFFVHVTDGRPTAGCVSMPVGDLLPLMRWLDPAQAPRIAMGPEADVLRM